MSDTSDLSGQFTRAFIGIHDKTPDMRIIYVTSSIRDILGFEPSEAVGQTALWFIENGNAEDYREHFGSHTDEDNVLITQVYVRTSSGVPVYVKLVNFNCDNLAFNVCFLSSETLPTRVERSPLRVEQVHSGGVSEQMMSRQHSLLTAHRERNRRATMLSGNRSARACLTLESIGGCTEDSPMGPRVLFASNSFDRIINIDACDVQGIPFLLLVASEDVAKAGRFLDNIKTASTVLIEHLLLLADPLAELTNDEQREPKTVAVEIMAAGADSGAVMLCQLARQPLCSGICELSDGYMSLEDIISSDPETSDIADVWGRV
ncbi:hypothetical protein GGI19_000046 [Coemansia pectinata]|uniref:PAS domain-containing protein n=1 Tax=Coemansia pectinata TaxID=1052879 RepID=A0A9W8H1N8_9FUNG|nr:hypothetical protein GGI19_000046 [Coemansia pectinata]